MPITFEQYIAEFEELGKYGEYSDRLKEELRDHFDDTVHSGLVMGKSEPSAKQTALKNLGESKIIIHEFKKIMKFNNKYALWMESLFFGILSLPIFQFVLLIFSIFGTYSHTIGIPVPAIGYILCYGIAFLIFTLLYFFIFRSVFRFLDTEKKLFIFLIGLFLPPLVFSFIFTDSIGSEISFLQYFLFAFVPAIVAAAHDCLFFIRKRKSLLQGKKESKFWQKIVSFIPFVIAIILIPSVLLTNPGFLPTESNINPSFIGLLSLIRSFLELINIPIIDFDITGSLGGYEGHYLFGFIYSFLFFICLYKIIVFFLDKTRIKNIQSFPWLFATLLVYIFSLFFLVTTPTQTNTQWHVPVENLSNIMKKEQIGFLYRPISYLDAAYAWSRQKSFYLYEVRGEANFFLIDNPDNGGAPHRFSVGFPNVDDSFDDAVIKVLGKEQGPILGLELRGGSLTNEPFFHGPKTLPPEVTCKRDSSKYISSPGATFYCHELYYKDQLIYTQNHAIPLYQFEIMPQYPQYAILKFNLDSYGPQELYLIRVSE